MLTRSLEESIGRYSALVREEGAKIYTVVKNGLSENGQLMADNNLYGPLSPFSSCVTGTVCLGEL